MARNIALPPATNLALVVVVVFTCPMTRSTSSSPPMSLPLRFQQLAEAIPEAPFLLDCSGLHSHANADTWCGGSGPDGGSSGDDTTAMQWTFARTHREVVTVGSALCAADATLPANHQTPSVRVVALFGRRSPQSYVALLAAWLAPCSALTVMPVNPWATPAELRRLFALARPTTLALTSLSTAQANALRTLEQVAPEVLTTIGTMVELASDIPTDLMPWCRRLSPLAFLASNGATKASLVDSAGGTVDGDGEAIALLLFTSGSTSSPKLVMVPHRQLWYGSNTLVRDGLGRQVVAAGSAPPASTLTAQDDPVNATNGEVRVIAAAVSLHWDVASYDLGLALTLSAALLVLPEDAFDRPFELRQTMAERGANVLFGTPSTLQRVLQLPPMSQGHTELTVAMRSVPPLHYAISTGEPFSASLAGRLRATIPNLQMLDCYGATEFSNVISQVLPAPATSGQVRWDGLAFDPITMSLRNPTEERGHLGTSTTGELVLKTAGLMRGYLSAEMQYGNSVQLPPPLSEYATGDVVSVRKPIGEAGAAMVFDVIGRTDRQVHVDGVRHNLDALEALFEQSEVVAAAASLLWQDRTRIHVFVSLSTEVGHWNDDDLTSALNDHAREIVNAMLPIDIHILSDDENAKSKLSSMPLTPTGKKDRKLLADRLLSLEAELRDEGAATRFGPWMWIHWGCSYALAFVNDVEAAVGQPRSQRLVWCPTDE